MEASGATIKGTITSSTFTSTPNALNDYIELKEGKLNLVRNNNNYIEIGSDGINTNYISASTGTNLNVTAEGTLSLRGDKGGALNGTWSVDNGTGTWSDINVKNTISLLSSDYSILFDNLCPVTYKYNNGTSDRLHTGFIAQEVKEALDKANIDSKDFAGLVIINPDTEEELWTLRYEEFIALNTNEIQKAKVRISELETRVSQLESLL